MYLDVEFTIRELISKQNEIRELLKKHEEIGQLIEKKKSTEKFIRENNFVYTFKDGKHTRLNKHQQRFLNVILPFLLKIDEPKIAEICEVFGLSVDDRMYGDDDEDM